MESSPLAKGWMLGRPHSLVSSKQQVLEQGVNSNEKSYELLKVWICELKVMRFGVILNKVYLNLSFCFTRKSERIV